MYKKMPSPKIKDRWSDGIDHEPGVMQFVKYLMRMDIEHFDDSFCFKVGGDGDNGETLAYIIDALIENGLVEIKINEIKE